MFSKGNDKIRPGLQGGLGTTVLISKILWVSIRGQLTTSCGQNPALYLFSNKVLLEQPHLFFYIIVYACFWVRMAGFSS